MTHTARLSVVAKRLQVLLAEKIDDTNFYAPAIRKVYYGDQGRIPEVPSICVEPSTKTRSRPTPTLMTENELLVDVLIYHSGADKVSEDVKYETDLLAEIVEEFLHQHVNLKDADGEPLVISSYVMITEPGYFRRQNSLFHGSRLQWRGLTKTQLTQAG